MKLLVIDGDGASRNYLTVMLRKNGYEVAAVSLGREGLIAAWKDAPDAILLDPFLPDLPGVELVERLRQDRRTANVPMVALANREDSALMSAVRQAGCNEYLVKSAETLQALLELLPRWQAGGPLAPPAPVVRGRLVAFLSAKGGTGTSSLCANLAMCIAARGSLRLAVMDLVLPIGSIADIVGYQEELNLVRVAQMPPAETSAAFFRENLPRIPGWQFYLLAGAQDPESASQLPVQRVEGLIPPILESHDLLFVDLGRSLSRIGLPVILQADVIVLVLGTDTANVTLTRTVWEYLKSQGVDPLRVYAINNRAVGLEGLTRADMEKTIGLPIRVTVPYTGENFTAANNRHDPFVARYPNDSASLLLEQTAGEIAEMVRKVRAH